MEPQPLATTPTDQAAHGEAEPGLARLDDFADGAWEEALLRLTRKGAAAWKDVPDATAWVEDLRGNSE